jgi:peroxiredoxin
MLTLQNEIDALYAEASKRIPASVRAELNASIDEVKRTGIAERALGVGALAPVFTLPNAVGKPISSTDLLQRGPLIISFYRGIWCPVCNLELRAYQHILGEIRASGSDLIAVSPQTPDSSMSTAEKNTLQFEVLSDHQNQLAREFGIAYPIPDIVKRINAQFGVDIAALNGDAGSFGEQLPISATYVVDQDRRIVLAEINPDYHMRLEPATALAAVREIVGRRKQQELADEIMGELSDG